MSLDRNVKEDSESIEIAYNWFEPVHRSALIFFLIWEILSLLFFHTEIARLLSGDLDPAQGVHMVLILIAMLVVPAYWSLMLVMNRTTLRFTRDYVQVSHGPLPSGRRNVRFATKMFHTIWVEPAHAEAREDAGWHLTAIFKDGSEAKMIRNMQSMEESEMICRRVMQWMNSLGGNRYSKKGGGGGDSVPARNELM